MISALLDYIRQADECSRSTEYFREVCDTQKEESQDQFKVAVDVESSAYPYM